MDENVRNYLDQYGVSDATRRFLAKPQKMFIDGAWVDSGNGATFDVFEPSTSGLVTRVPSGTTEDLDRAVKAARRQFDGGAWRRLKPLERERLIHRLADLIEAHADELAEIEAIDMGKSVTFAREVDVQGTIDTFRYFAGWASKLHGRTVEPSLPGNYLAYTRKEPLGVVAAIVPWNFPLQTMAWKLAAALAVGCTTIVKPAELTSLATLRFGELVQEAGIPDGVVNIVTGRGSVIGAAMSAHPGIDKVTFTGSTPVGQEVGRTAVGHLKHVTLELGGKSPVLVLDDADLASAARAVVNGVFFNSGQVCDAGTRVYVQRSVHDAFLDELVAVTRTLKVAPGLDRDCYIGPLVSAQQKKVVSAYIEAGRREGAELIHGGGSPDRPGHFIEPAIFARCKPEMSIVREEIFGPVLVTDAFDELDDAVALANDSAFGLAAAIYSNDLSRVHGLIPRLNAGSIYVNAHSTIDPSMPFGGFKASGFGKDLGPEQLDYLMETKAVWITLP
ncbi:MULTISPECIES: aldehyde dehydrogenase family protein [Ensifer]|uniref:Aldehyde dehydrogenase family protein n=1 Tax=Ensifer canadensis TaxID=555315 RepID=A0AAW4FEE4_9HYPH|nr:MULTISPECIES: aldehyde dehydrogenase family protein [Ensifer]MDP9629262.1 phenylacetaldehyde dehydrogenase [Ensifer adhaerens]KQU90623.1 betaine-aldehyde dehydrogenase [Ensifer sp. Root31]MBM3090462.1 aldehyde dehydrogenase family protein [Ensifer canadensis]OMQ46485.1 betaine-aldehyde dehydrogenase [Ensifer sp. 1H6]UBI80897.1 aldehyde dehydrogenase family protein [Ensifer canadensis]